MRIFSAATDIDDAVIKKHIQGKDTSFGIQIENLNMGMHKITGLVDPANPQDAATKKYIDDVLAGWYSNKYVSDIAYAASWNGVTNIAPSKNAVYDKIEAIGSASVSDIAYAASWNGVVNIAPSKNAVYDKIEALDISGLDNIVEDLTPQLGGNLDMNDKLIGGNSEAQLDDAISKKHTQGTDTALGAQAEILNMNTHKIIGVVDPTAAQDVATKAYGDAHWTGGGELPNGNQGSSIYKGETTWLAGNTLIVASGYTGTHREKIQAAINEAQNSGGIVYIPKGVWTITSSITVSQPITIFGDGRQATVLRATNGNFPIFSVNCASAPTIRDMKIEDSGTSTSGSTGVRDVYAGGSGSQRLILRDLLIVNMYNGIEIIDGHRFTLDNCQVAGFKSYGIYVANDASPDGGDSVISGCIVSQSSGVAATAAIYQKSGGGLKLIGNKLLGGSTGSNGCSHGIRFDFNYSGGSAVFLITGNSIENFKTQHISLDKSSSGAFGGITIVSNELASWSGALAKGITIACDGADNLSDITIVGNTFNNAGVTINDGKNVIITSNVFVNGANRTYAISNAGGTNVQASSNLFSGYSGVNTYYHGIFSPVAHAGDLYLYDDNGPVDLQLRAKVGNDALVSFYELHTLKAAVYWDSSASKLKLYPAGGHAVTIDATGRLTACDLVDSGACDYVFEPDYNLMSLDNLDKYIKKNTKLPGIITEDGISVSELYEKTEEQALYILQLHSRLEVLEGKKSLT